MQRITHLTSIANPKVKQVVRLREHRQRRRTGLFIAEGVRELSRAHSAGLRIVQLFRCDELLNARPQRLDALAQLNLDADPSIEHYTTTEPVLTKMAYLAQPEGVLAVVEQPECSLDTLPAATASARYVVAVGMAKPGNLGAVVRTAEAAGFDAVLAPGPVDAFNPNAIRTSTCAVFTLPVVSASEQAIRDYLRDHHIRAMPATLEGSISHTHADWRTPLAIIVGPEDTGLTRDWLELAEQTAGQRVFIPMRQRIVDSLNASNAAAILMFEAIREREP